MDALEEDEGPYHVRLLVRIILTRAHRCICKCTCYNPWGGRLYILVHVTVLESVGNPLPNGAQWMSDLESPSIGQGEIVVWIRNIEGAVHLVQLKPKQRWVVNNHVDYHVLNQMNNGL